MRHARERLGPANCTSGHWYPRVSPFTRLGLSFHVCKMEGDDINGVPVFDLVKIQGDQACASQKGCLITVGWLWPVPPGDGAGVGAGRWRHRWVGPCVVRASL